MSLVCSAPSWDVSAAFSAAPWHQALTALPWLAQEGEGALTAQAMALQPLLCHPFTLRYFP